MSSSNSLASSLMLFFLLSSLAEAKDILIVGKTDSWKIPSSQFDLLNQWAEKNRFSIGDSLGNSLKKLKAEAISPSGYFYSSILPHLLFCGMEVQWDSVLQVSRGDYKNCNVSNPIKEYKTGNDKIVLDRSRPYFFISGAKGHCEQEQKLVVIVLSEKHNRFIGVSPISHGY